MTNGERILVIAHGHPDFSLGGGEIAAYNLFKAYRENTQVDDAWFLARVDRGFGPTGKIHLRREHEYLWEQGIADDFMRSANREAMLAWFADLIRQLKPTIVHAHHYVHLGIEMFRIIKQIDPNIRVYLTLHEYLAICVNSGQMIKTNGRLCQESSDEDCHRCYPNRTIEDFWLRRHFIRENLEFVDGFISPSQFLKDRYVAWGLDPRRFEVIENGQKEVPKMPLRSLDVDEKRSRFGFFGQINKFKGLGVLLRAIHEMDEETRSQIRLEVNGTNLDKQPEPFQEEIRSLSDDLIDEGTVVWKGSYKPNELQARMREVDWVCVPSIWWENSPMVIQEALSFGRPLLVSNIGGMTEKVLDEETGLHVPVASWSAWKDAMIRAMSSPQLCETFWQNIVQPLSYEDCADRHLDVFHQWESVS